MNDLLDELWERRLDWGLAEIQGGAAPPDVKAAVLARIGAVAAPAVVRAVPRRLVAALAGIGVVAAVWWSSRESATVTPVPGATVPQEPAAVVRTPEDAAALPPGTREVVIVNQGDDVVRTVTERCPQLHKMTIDCLQDPATSPTDRAFAMVANLSQLRLLSLVKALAVTGTGLRELTRLPVLETLALGFMQLPEPGLDALPDLPALRVLDLSYTRGAHGQGMAAIARCAGLRQLAISGCRDLDVSDLTAVERLTSLEILEARQLQALGAGKIDFSRLSRLTDLVLQSSPVTPAFLQSLPSSLTSLDLGGTAVDDEVCELLARHLPALRCLRVCRTAVGDAGVVRLLALDHLVRLELFGCSGVTTASIAGLAASESLQVVGLDGSCLAPDHVERLMARGIDVCQDPIDRMRNAGPAAMLAGLRQRYATAIEQRKTGSR